MRIPHKSNRARLALLPIITSLLWGYLRTALSFQCRSGEKFAVCAPTDLHRRRVALVSLATALAVIVNGDTAGPVLAVATAASIGPLVVVARPGPAGVFLFFAEDGGGGLGKVFLGRQDLPQIVDRHLGISSGIVWLGRQSDLTRHQLR